MDDWPGSNQQIEEFWALAVQDKGRTTPEAVSIPQQVLTGPQGV